MGVSYSPKIVTDSIFLYLDPSNPKCFIPGETTCKNLITKGLVTGASGSPGSGVHTPNPSNFPTYNPINGGVFDFAGGKGMNFEEDLGSRTTLTFSIWFFKKNTSTEYFSDARNNGGQWFLANYQERNITYTHALAYNFNGNSTSDYISSGPNFINQWYNMTLTSNNSESKLYLNGSEVNGYVNNSSIVETFGKNFRIGTRFTTSSQWTGYMGNIVAWNNVLTDKEILQNYNATKGRYGL
jgi:hypothetical protein